MSEPWEEEWHRGNGDAGEDPWSVYDAKGGLVCERFISADDIQITIAAPDMARALLAIRERVAQAGDALPRPRNADEMAAMEDSFVTIPTEMLRAAFDALRKAGAL